MRISMIKYADLNAQRDADADFNGSEMLICRSQCRHNLLFDQPYIGEGGFVSAAENGAVQNNF